MKKLIIAFAMFGLATAAVAQSDSTKPAQPQGAQSSQAGSGQAAAQTPQTLATVVERQVSSYERNVVGVAEAMPEDKYNFTPASLNIPNAAFKDVRTFAQLIKHTAAANYFFWSAVTGEKPPESIKGPNGPDELKSKAEIIQFLKDSFAAGHRAAKILTPENAFEQVQFLQFKGPRLFMATNAVIHCADEYGQMVEYLRMNGVVPPASAGAR